MKQIPLKNSDQLAQCDDEDFDYLNQFNWHLDKDGYAVRYDYETGDVIEMGYEVLKLHGEI
jgi:hypothetical protein